ncbi:MAG: methyltransferase [Clostridia bacterium]|nr:methyltransferase [Clostridia bacterium]
MNNTLYENETLTSVNENINLIQRKNGLTFGTDAFLLASFLKEQKSGVAVELGGGTGIISLLSATREKFKKIYCAEIQPEFADVITRNVKLNSLEEKIVPICADVRELKSANIGCEVEAVFSNPPYMKADSGKRNEHDEKFIARHEVCGDIGDFCACAKRLLKHGGLFYCVWRPDRLIDLVCAMRENSLEPKEMCFVHANTKSAPSMVLVKAKKGAASGMTVIEPLFLNEDDNPKVLTERAKKIYKECNF